MGIPFVMLNATGWATVLGGQAVWALDEMGWEGYDDFEWDDLGDSIRITATGYLSSPGAATIGVSVYSPTGLGAAALAAASVSVARATDASVFIEFLLTIEPDPEDEAALTVVTNGVVLCAGGPIGGLTAPPKYVQRNLNQQYDIDLYIELAGAGAKLILDQLVIEYLYAADGGPFGPIPQGQEVASGNINGNAPGTTFTPTNNNTGTLSVVPVYAGTWYAATATQDLGTTNNTQAVAFTYQGPEGGGGPAAGVRWSGPGQQGDFGFLNTNTTPPVIEVYEMPTGFGTGTSATSSPLTLTSGNSYTLTVVDNGTTITASLTDDVGPQSAGLTPTVPPSNTQTMFGWVGLTSGYTFSAPITLVATSSVATPTFTPGAGSYANAQHVMISVATTGAAIFYTTDGSTPTTSSTPYTGPISVSASETIKAIGALDGWANSAIASAGYTIASWTIESGTIDGISSGTLTPIGNDRGMTSGSAVYASTWPAATAFQNIATSNNTVAVTFTFTKAPKGTAAWRPACAGTTHPKKAISRSSTPMLRRQPSPSPN